MLNLDKIFANRKFIVYGNALSLILSVFTLIMVVRLSKKYSEQVGFHDDTTQIESIETEKQIIDLDQLNAKEDQNQTSQVVVATDIKPNERIVIKDNISQTQNDDMLTIKNNQEVKNQNINKEDKKIVRTTTKVTKPQPAKSTGASNDSKSVLQSKPIAIQIGSFIEEKAAKMQCVNFNKIAQKIPSIAQKNCKIIKHTASNSKVFRVFISKFDNKKSADAACSTLQQNGVKCIVVLMPN